MRNRSCYTISQFKKITELTRAPERESLAQKILRGVGIMVCGKAAISGFGFATRIVLARLLGPANLGVYGILTNAVGLCVMFTNIGTQNAHIHDLGKGRSTPESDLGFAVLYSMSAGILGIVAFFLVYNYWLSDWYFSKYFDQKYPLAIFVFVCIPVNILLLHLSSIILGLKRFITYNIFFLVKSGAFLGLIIGFAACIGPPLQSGLAAYTGAGMLTAGMFLFYLVRQFRLTMRFAISEIGHKFGYGSKAMASGIAEGLTLQCGVFMAGYFLESVEVGLFFLANSLFQMSGQSTTILGRVLFPYASSMDLDEAGKMTTGVFRVFLSLCIFGLVLFIPASIYGVPLIFGTAYCQSGFVLALMIPGAISLCLMRILYSYFLGRGQPGKPVIAYFITFASVVVLDIGFIPMYGIEGAALGLTGAYIIGLATIVCQYTSLTHTSYSELFLPRKSDFENLLEKLFRRQAQC